MIVVFGGTGTVGRQIAKLLRDQGHPVRIATRNPDRLPPGLHGIAEVARCDLTDRSSLAPALAGAHVVVCTAHGGDGRGRSGPRGIEGRAIPDLIQAAAGLAVRHFIYISAASASPDSPAELFRLKAAAETSPRQSGLPHSILRPTHLLDTWAPLLARPLAARARAMVIGGGNNPVSWVAAADIAAAAAHLAAQPGQGLTADLGGPEPLTLRQLNEHLARALGVTIKRTTAMPTGMLRAAAALARPFSEVLARQMQLGLLLDTRPQVVNSAPAWQHLGTTPATPSQWIDAHPPELLAGHQPSGRPPALRPADPTST